MTLISLILLHLFLAVDATEGSFDNNSVVRELIGVGSKLVSFETVSNPKCKQDLKLWVTALQTYVDTFFSTCDSSDVDCEQNKKNILANNLFAAKQLDAFGRIPPNFLSFNGFWFGSFDECLKVKSPLYKTKFCHVSLGIDSYIAIIKRFTSNHKNSSCDLIKKPQWSVCVPESCLDEDLANAFRDSIKRIGLIGKVCSVKCVPRKLIQADMLFWITLCGIAVIVVLALTSSFCDLFASLKYHWRLRESVCTQCFLSFSQIQSFLKISNTRRNKHAVESLPFIKTVSVFWIISYDTIKEFFWSADNPIALLQSTTFIGNSLFFNGYFAIDSFLFVAGFSLAYLFFEDIEKQTAKWKSLLYWCVYYVHRILRTTILYGFFILLVIAIHENVTDGPLFQNHVNINHCRKYWWRNLLYINNFYGSNDVCMEHLWYIAVEMQLYILAPLVMIPLFLRPALGALVVGITIIISSVFLYLSYFAYNFPTDYFGFYFDIFDAKRVHSYKLLVNDALWIRCTPYLIGICSARALHQIKNRSLNVSLAQLLSLWILSLGVACSCLFGLYDYYQGPEHDMPILARASYNFFSRICWALFLSWLVVACEKNLAGPLKQFIEHRFWKPIGRLSYSVYIVHYLAMDFLFARERLILHFVGGIYQLCFDIFPVIIGAYVCGYFWSALFEIPFIGIGNIIVKYVFRSAVCKQQFNVPLPADCKSKEKFPKGRQLNVIQDSKL